MMHSIPFLCLAALLLGGCVYIDTSVPPPPPVVYYVQPARPTVLPGTSATVVSPPQAPMPAR
jgi:hypothetical protein